MNVLWMTKKSLAKASTSRECAKWGFNLFPLYGTASDKLTTMKLLESLPGDLHVITNYESINNKDLREKFASVKWGAIVIDEVHKLKGGANSTPTKIWKNTARLVIDQVASHACFPIFLTGSPIQNKPEEMWAYLHMFDPNRFEKLSDFTRIFANRDWRGMVELDTPKLLKVLAPNMMRRRKDEVGIQLPPKNILEPEEIEVDPSCDFADIQRKLNEDVWVEFDGMDDDAVLSLSSLLAKLHYLRALNLAPGRLKYNTYPIDPSTGERASTPVTKLLEFKPPFPKLDAVFEKICELRDEGENVIVFSAQYNTPLNYLKNLLTEVGHTCGMIYEGSDAAAAERAFQSGETNVLLCNLKSAAEGLNLHRCDDWPGGASHVIFLDRWWNPELNRQGEDRTWRVGTNKPVFIHKFFVMNSVDYLIEAIEEKKRQMAAGIVEDEKIRVGEWKRMLHQFLGAPAPKPKKPVNEEED